MNEVMVPCMLALREGATNAKGCLANLQRRFNLSDEEMDERIPSGMRTRLFDRADWAIFHLMKAGLIDRPKRGVYVLSDLGRDWLGSGKETLSLADLQKFPAYAEWKSETSSNLPRSSGTELEQEPLQDATPEDTIADASTILDAALRADVLGAVLSLSPARFEQLIVDLLLAMGYGGGDADMGRALGKSGDGGIDGVINEDKLGLDAVYVQAKRYAPENTVGRPAIQAFVGSLTGEGATKGVFVTTSNYSKEARAYVDRIAQRVVLIDGDRLARLMIAHDVGVRIRQTIHIRSIDEDYFSEI